MLGGCFIFLGLSAQKPHSIAVEGGGMLAFYTYTYDSLVPPKKQGKAGLLSDACVNVYYSLPAFHSSLKLKIGFGYVDRTFNINKYSLGDFIAAFFIFDGVRRRDSFHIRQVRIRNQYLNIPVGISYRLAKGRPKRVEVYGGIQLNVGVLLSSKANAFFDSAWVIPTSAQKENVEQEYSKTASRFVVNILPRLDMKINVFHDLGLYMNLQPFVFYFNSSNKRLIRNSVGFNGDLGIYYDF